jgi:hypothetical protein
MRELWNFMTKDKMEKFEVILKSHELEYEVTCKEKNKYVISVNESDYTEAKRVLLKYRERRTSGDLINSNDTKHKTE